MTTRRRLRSTTPSLQNRTEGCENGRNGGQNGKSLLDTLMPSKGRKGTEKFQKKKPSDARARAKPPPLPPVATGSPSPLRVLLEPLARSASERNHSLVAVEVFLVEQLSNRGLDFLDLVVSPGILDGSLMVEYLEETCLICADGSVMDLEDSLKE